MARNAGYDRGEPTEIGGEAARPAYFDTLPGIPHHTNVSSPLAWKDHRENLRLPERGNTQGTGVSGTPWRIDPIGGFTKHSRSHTNQAGRSRVLRYWSSGSKRVRKAPTVLQAIIDGRQPVAVTLPVSMEPFPVERVANRAAAGMATALMAWSRTVDAGVVGVAGVAG